MKDIHIKAIRGIYISPSVDFEVETGICEIKGESFLEETSNFYSPLADWLYEYTKTSKWLLNLLHILREYQINNGEIKVNWYYYKDDIDMSEEIDDYIIDSGIKINKIPI